MKKIVLVLFMLFMSVNFAFAENADIEQLTERANNGDTQAQFELGESYYSKGVKEDYELSAYWYQKAAEQGLDLAQYKLGLCYYLGEGVAQDYNLAVSWWQKAAEQGHAQAKSELAKWWQKAAEQGDVQAQYELANCYFLGNGVDLDYKTAAYWNQQSAVQGYAMAQYNLGMCYYRGQGVPQSIKHAYMWTSLALARTSNADDTFIISDLLEGIKADMTDTQIAEAEQMTVKWQKQFEKSKK